MTVKNYLNKEGKLKVWPAKQEAKRDVLAYMSTKFEFGRDYTEKEVNAIIDANHAFGDYFLLRRGMVDLGVMARTPDGARYWRVMQEGNEL